MKCWPLHMPSEDNFPLLYCTLDSSSFSRHSCTSPNQHFNASALLPSSNNNLFDSSRQLLLVSSPGPLAECVRTREGNGGGMVWGKIHALRWWVFGQQLNNSAKPWFIKSGTLDSGYDLRGVAWGGFRPRASHPSVHCYRSN